MDVDLRREPRTPATGLYSITWHNGSGAAFSLELQGKDISLLGICLCSPQELSPGTIVFINGPGGAPHGSSIVRHCTYAGAVYLVGIEFGDAAKQSEQLLNEEPTDYYDVLQISPKAEATTIQRVYRFLAARYHPDNPQTGNTEKFVLLNRIYRVLSDPQQRAAYDATRQQAEPTPIAEPGEFVTGIDGEMNRRLAILALLYNKRRTNSQDPNISLWDLERKMAMPREFLDFATWYLKSKGYITVADNSDFALTALGVDYVESNANGNITLQKLLTAGGMEFRSASDEGTATPPKTARYQLESRKMAASRRAEVNGFVNGSAAPEFAAAGATPGTAEATEC